MNKQDLILKEITDIKVINAKIEGHLSVLNSKVATNVKEIENNREKSYKMLDKFEQIEDKINKIKWKLAYWTGGVMVFLGLIGKILN